MAVMESVSWVKELVVLVVKTLPTPFDTSWKMDFMSCRVLLFAEISRWTTLKDWIVFQIILSLIKFVDQSFKWHIHNSYAIFVKKSLWFCAFMQKCFTELRLGACRTFGPGYIDLRLFATSSCWSLHSSHAIYKHGTNCGC